MFHDILISVWVTFHCNQFNPTRSMWRAASCWYFQSWLPYISALPDVYCLPSNTNAACRKQLVQFFLPRTSDACWDLALFPRINQHCRWGPVAPPAWNYTTCWWSTLLPGNNDDQRSLELSHWPTQRPGVVLWLLVREEWDQFISYKMWFNQRGPNDAQQPYQKQEVWHATIC